MKENYWVGSDGMLLSRLDFSLKQWQEAAEAVQQMPRGIPRLIHFIWLGSPVPVKFLPMIDSWRRYHPEYQVITWDDTLVLQGLLPSASAACRAAFTRADNFGEKSDVLRYEILFQHGGLYVDCDVECLACLDGILGSPGLGFLAGLGNCDVVEIQSCLLASVPGHPLCQAMIQNCALNCGAVPKMPNGFVSKGTDLASLAGVLSFLAPADADAMRSACRADLAMRTNARTGSGALTRIIDQYLEENEEGGGGIVVFPPEIFSPVPNSISVDLLNGNSSDECKQTFITGDSLAVHWSQKTWQ